LPEPVNAIRKGVWILHPGVRSPAPGIVENLCRNRLFAGKVAIGPRA
jgi:hypothetical protein